MPAATWGVSCLQGGTLSWGGFGWLLHLNNQASNISLLRREATYAWVLRSHCSGLSLAPSLVRWSAFSFLVMFVWPGTQLTVITVSSTSLRLSLMCDLKARDCSWAFPGVPLCICDMVAGLSLYKTI